MTLRPAPLALVVTFGIVTATPAMAGLPAFSFTGTWSGTAHSKGQTAAMSADFTSTSPKAFTGTVTIEFIGTCEVNGKYARPVRLHVTCNGSPDNLVAHLNREKETLTGAFLVSHHRQRVTYTLTKSP